MTEIFKTEFSDIETKGNVTLYKNHFNNGNPYFARFDRSTVNIENLIARIQKKDIGINPIIAKNIITLIKVEVKNALKRAESISVFDLGTLYLSARGTKGISAETASIEKVQLKFTPSKEATELIKNVEIQKVTVAFNSPIIETITDLKTKKTDCTITAGKPISLAGSRLKVLGEESGIFFALCKEDETYSEDESTWIKIPTSELIRNFNKNVEFFVPDEFETGAKYRIILRTNYSKCNTLKKVATTVVSDVVTVN